eukprot:TRINITY_DN1521_c1_g3_i1.p1 TRINITY_DN1521_c1_g3~~TRINITY_DN1521_c1_g3_i1.p1  ORF type:complete len:842 (+),score=209.73 TRINITY_DN1521_c1_g3_i1:78-2603(+)
MALHPHKLRPPERRQGRSPGIRRSPCVSLEGVQQAPPCPSSPLPLPQQQAPDDARSEGSIGECEVKMHQYTSLIARQQRIIASMETRSGGKHACADTAAAGVQLYLNPDLHTALRQNLRLASPPRPRSPDDSPRLLFPPAASRMTSEDKPKSAAEPSLLQPMRTAPQSIPSLGPSLSSVIPALADSRTSRNSRGSRGPVLAALRTPGAGPPQQLQPPTAPGPLPPAAAHRDPTLEPALGPRLQPARTVPWLRINTSVAKESDGAGVPPHWTPSGISLKTVGSIGTTTSDRVHTDWKTVATTESAATSTPRKGASVVRGTGIAEDMLPKAPGGGSSGIPSLDGEGRGQGRYAPGLSTPGSPARSPARSPANRGSPVPMRQSASQSAASVGTPPEGPESGTPTAAGKSGRHATLVVDEPPSAEVGPRRDSAASRATLSQLAKRVESVLDTVREPDGGGADDSDDESRHSFAWSDDTKGTAAGGEGQEEDSRGLQALWRGGAKPKLREWPAHRIVAPGGELLSARPVVCGSADVSDSLRFWHTKVSAGAGKLPAAAKFGGSAQRRVVAMAADPIGTSVIVGTLAGGAGELLCWDTELLDWRWKWPTQACTTLTCTGGRYVHGAASGQLWLRRTKDDPNSEASIPLPLEDISEGSCWDSLSLEPPYLVGTDKDGTLYVWSSRKVDDVGWAGMLMGRRSFTEECAGFLPNVEIVGVHSCCVRDGMIATVHATRNGNTALICLWDAESGQHQIRCQYPRPASGVALTVSGSRQDGVIVLVDAKNLIMYHVGDLCEPLGEWSVPAAAGPATSVFAVGTGTVISVHKHGVVEWSSTKALKSAKRQCSVM